MFCLFIEKDFESFPVFDEVLILQVWLPQMHVPRTEAPRYPGKHVRMDEERWTHW